MFISKDTEEKFYELIKNNIDDDAYYKEYIAKKNFVENLDKLIDPKYMFRMLIYLDGMVSGWESLDKEDWAVYYETQVKGKNNHEEYYKYITDIYKASWQGDILTYDYWYNKFTHDEAVCCLKQQQRTKYKDIINKVAKDTEPEETEEQ